MHCMRSQWKTRRIEIAISLQLFFMLLHDHDFSDPAFKNTFIARGRNQTHAINNPLLKSGGPFPCLAACYIWGSSGEPPRDRIHLLNNFYSRLRVQFSRDSDDSAVVWATSKKSNSRKRNN